MADFPGKTIVATEASYAVRSGPFGLASIAIRLAPFQFDAERHDTSLRCDQIDLDLGDLSALAGKVFDFPLNPEPGYIDGSLYLLNRHVLFLTRRLSFGVVTRDAIPLKIEGLLEFSSSGLPGHADVELCLETALPLPPTPAELGRLVEQAINETGARSPRDVGKVMALLARNPRARDQLAELNGEVRRVLLARDGRDR